MANDANGSRAVLTLTSQGGAEIPVATIVQQDEILMLSLKAIGAECWGEINKDGTEMSGRWSEGGKEFLLRFRRTFDGAGKEAAGPPDEMKPRKRLDLATLAALPGEENGPNPAAKPKQLATESPALPPAVPPAVSEVRPLAPSPVDVAPPAPSSEAQDRVLDAARDYAINYTRRLPDFICLEETRRYRDPSGGQSWHLADILAARLSYFNQMEDYKLISQNGHAVKGASYDSVEGAQSRGDFGTIMSMIFDPGNHAGFTWKKWTMVRGRRVHVFSYRVPLEYSRFTIEYQSGDENELHRIRVGSRGSVFVDKELNTIVRIEQEALGIEPSFPIQRSEETLEYGFTKIGDSEFFLPLVATLRMRSGGVWTMNVKEFRQYRRFSADAVISFDSEKPPLPDDGVK